jgi:hypothetical protein
MYGQTSLESLVSQKKPTRKSKVFAKTSGIMEMIVWLKVSAILEINS